MGDPILNDAHTSVLNSLTPSITWSILGHNYDNIETIYRYIRKTGSKTTAKDMVDSIRKACDSLSENPERGLIPQ